MAAMDSNGKFNVHLIFSIVNRYAEEYSQNLCEILRGTYVILVLISKKKHKLTLSQTPFL